MTRSLRLRILTGAAVSAVLSGAAHAQSPAPASAPAPAKAPAAPAGPTDIVADHATRDADGRMELTGHAEAVNADRTVRADKIVNDADGRMEATGQVEAVTAKRSLRADQATFDPNTAVITASGKVRIYQPDGSVENADTITFTQDMSTGVATNFSAQIVEKVPDPSTGETPHTTTVAAANIIRRDENFTEMNRAIFTACALCDPTGAAKNPTWSISADKVVRDEANGSINFKNAWISIEGQPVIPLPYFSMADPEIDRKSGLLAPDFQHTVRRGITYDQPYLWSISPYQDLIIAPQINTEVNPFVNFDWRKRFYSGQVEALAGYGYDRDFNTSGLKFGPAHSKGFIFANGEFKPADDWTWGFTAEEARDRRVFDQYSLNYTPPEKGLFEADDRRLISQLYAVRQDDQSYLSVAALGFQSLRPLPGPPNIFGLRDLEDDKSLPFVGPLVEFRFNPDTTIAGGRVRLVGSGVILNQTDSAAVLGQPGIDSSRGTIEGDWRRTFTTSGGLRIVPFADARADYYQTADLTPADTATHANSRNIETAGADISWPLVRMNGPVTTTVEPIIQIALSPDAKPNSQIPNEDSLALQFDDTNLFSTDPSPGFDLYEGGQRISAGVRTTFDWADGRSARFLVGQTFRAKPDPLLPAQSGLQGKTSDWVFDAEVTPATGLSFFTRGRLDDWSLQHIEAGIDANTAKASGYVRYMRTDEDLTGNPAEDIEGAGQVFITKNWGVLANATRDLEEKTWRRRSIGAVYQDDCLRFELLYQRDNNPLLGAKDSSSVVFRLTLATLGDTGYNSFVNRRPGAR